MYMSTIVGRMPSDVFTVGHDVTAKATTLFVTVGALAIFFTMAKQLFKANTFLSAITAVCGAIVLVWLVNQATNTQLQKPFDETVKTVINGAPPSPHLLPTEQIR